MQRLRHTSHPRVCADAAHSWCMFGPHRVSARQVLRSSTAHASAASILQFHAWCLCQEDLGRRSACQVVAQLDQARERGLECGAQVRALLRLHHLVVRLRQLVHRLQVAHVRGCPLPPGPAQPTGRGERDMRSASASLRTPSRRHGRHACVVGHSPRSCAAAVTHGGAQRACSVPSPCNRAGGRNVTPTGTHPPVEPCTGPVQPVLCRG